MNKIRRKKIENIAEKLERIMIEFERVHDDEESCYNNLPENLQYSSRAEEMEEAIDIMDTIIDNISEIIDMAKELI